MGQVCVQEDNSSSSSSHSMSLQRLLNSRMLELRRQFLPSSASSQERSLHLRRNLFGPIDHEENLRFVREEMDKLAQVDCQRWNFDFQADKPREGHYAWQAVREGVSDTNELPALTCRTSHATTCLTTTAATTHATPSHATTCHTTTTATTHAATNPTTPTNNRSVKRLHHKTPHKSASKLCTDYFGEVKSARQADKSKFVLDKEFLSSVKNVNTKLSEILKIKSTTN
ncbi:uncharacterized protein [Panulirus ornatus]|uniref:uncharacterized protein n=1 Tax=Panulirus ornatus TaxID=150431 RepID=UPI003A8A2893